MKIYKNFILISFIGTSLLFSCEKKQDPEPSQVSALPANANTEKLINKKWGYAALAIEQGGIDVTTWDGGMTFNDFFDPKIKELFPCATDDSIQFLTASSSNLEGTYFKNINDTCVYGGRSDSGSWKFNADQTELILTSTNTEVGVETWRIHELTNQNIKITTKVIDLLHLKGERKFDVNITYANKQPSI